MTPKDKCFYQALGQRIAQLRKAQGFTQTQLAEILGISQQTMAHYEGGRLRVAVSMLPGLARALTISVEELLDTQAMGLVIHTHQEVSPAEAAIRLISARRAKPHEQRNYEQG